MVPQRIIAAMQRYDWPGNIRELQNSVHRYITLGEIDFLDLPQPAEMTTPTRALKRAASFNRIASISP